MQRILALLFLFLLLPCASYASDGYYATFEGRISLTGSEPLIKTIIHVGDGDLYTLSGSLAEELKALSRFRVVVTGRVSAPTYPSTEGHMLVEDYSLAPLTLDEGRHWVLGVLRRSGESFVMVGDNQVIYTISNPEVLDTFDHIDRRALLIGTMQCTGNYSATLHIESFKIIGAKP